MSELKTCECGEPTYSNKCSLCYADEVLAQPQSRERMTTKDEALKLALEAMETLIVDVKTTPTAYEAQRQAIAAIKEALAQPKQEPVFAFRRKGLNDFCTCTEDRYNEFAQKPNLFEVKKFYTAPPQREWVGLTEDERDRIILGHRERWGIAHMIEAALKEKNA